MDISNQIKAIRLNNNLSIKDFADKIGVDSSQYGKIEKGKLAPTLKQVAEVSSVFGISTDWIILGKENIARSAGIDVAQQGEEVAESKWSVAETGNKSRIVSIPKDDQTKVATATRSTKGIPLIPLNAMAGYGTGEFQILEHECDHYVVPMFKNADFLISVHGDSMQPKYNSGDVVACKKLPLTDLFFQWNKVYVIDSAQGPLIKRVQKGTNDDRVILVSENKEYAPFELDKSQINAVALVVGVIRLE